MDYTDFSHEQLLERINELELLNGQLLMEREQDTKLEYGWTGNLGHWYWNVKTNSVTFNPLKITTLGYEKSEIPENVTYQFFTDKLHPEDYQKTMDVMMDHLYGKVNVYEVEYRIQTKDGDYKWYYDRGKITKYDEDGKPLFLAGIVFDITEKKRLQEELEYKNKILAEMSSIDGLTKISNHRTLVEYLTAGIADVGRVNSSLCIAIFDIDDFKQINDRNGHVYGDEVLIEIAAIIKNSIRSTDLAGRYGGEEFMVVFMNTELEIAATIAERIRKSIENTLFANGISVTISGGVKQYNGENVTDFIHEADKNLYEAKNAGKNLVISK
ncbi:MAG: diguanylate cyclase [Anaerostipes sp.]|nr:diguanylate cyclase [Anaerostipes sp.]